MDNKRIRVAIISTRGETFHALLGMSGRQANVSLLSLK